MFTIAQIVYPYDPPLGQFTGNAENKGAGSDITVGTLLKRFNVLSVAGCTCCALFGFTFKESILEPTCMNFFGLSSSDTAFVQMIESIMFVGFSLIISIIPDRKKNFNKLCLFGTIFYTLSMLFEGPLIGIPANKSNGIYWIGVGIALGGIGGALIMPAAMPALDESLRGCFPPGKDA